MRAAGKWAGPAEAAGKPVAGKQAVDKPVVGKQAVQVSGLWAGLQDPVRELVQYWLQVQLRRS